MTAARPVALVTGASSGIGKAAALALAEAGFDVGVTWHSDEEGARETASEVEGHGRRAEMRQLDLGQLPEAGDVIDDLAEALGGVDVLVNNAGLALGRNPDPAEDEAYLTLGERAAA